MCYEHSKIYRQEILQNAEKMGTGLRSVAMRIRGISEESEEADPELANITGDLIDLTKTAEHSQGISIFKPGSTTEFKSLVEYFDEISERWKEMNEKQRSDYLAKAFGKVQAQTGAAIITNFDQVRSALEKMENAGGAADAEMSIIRDSIDYKLNELRESWVGTWQELIQRDDLKKIIGFLTEFSNALGGVITTLGPFKTLGLGVGLFAGIKNFGRRRELLPLPLKFVF